MDRRKFLVGAGSLGAVASGGVAAIQSGGANRAEGLAKAARGGTTPPAVRPPTNAPTVEGMVLGYLPGSAALVTPGAAAPRTTLKWAAWDKSMSPPSASVRRVLGAERFVNISIGGLQRAVGGPNVQPIRSVQVVAHFATADSNFAPFYAWGFSAAAPAKRASASSGLSFDALAPDRMALQVDYALDASAVNRDVKASGMIYLPVASTDGPGAGIYVLAGPSRSTGTQPNLAGYVYSGDPLYPIVNTRKAEPDFDYVTITIRPA